MNLYILSTNVDIYDCLLLANSDQWEIFDAFNGQSIINKPTRVDVRYFKCEKSGDFPYLASHVPVFNERAFKTLQPLISQNIESFQLESESDSLYAINVLKVVDCLDYEKSEIEWLPEGNIMLIDRYVFKNDCAKGEHIFKIRQAELKDVLVSEEFKKLVESSGLEGLIFNPIS